MTTPEEPPRRAGTLKLYIYKGRELYFTTEVLLDNVEQAKQSYISQGYTVRSELDPPIEEIPINTPLFLKEIKEVANIGGQSGSLGLPVISSV